MPNYNRPITIQKYSGGVDAAYNLEDRTLDGNWEEYWTGFCREVPQSSREFFRTARLDARIDRVFKTRWNPEINTIDSQNFRVKFEEKIQYLTGPPLDEEAMDRELTLTCTQWVEAMT